MAVDKYQMLDMILNYILATRKRLLTHYEELSKTSKSKISPPHSADCNIWKLFMEVYKPW